MIIGGPTAYMRPHRIPAAPPRTWPHCVLGPSAYCGPAAYRGPAPNNLASLSRRLAANIFSLLVESDTLCRNE